MGHGFYITPEEYAQASLNGISPALLEVRVRSLAWPKDRAVNTLPHKKKPLSSYVQLAQENGICYSTLRYRVNQLGWDPIKAATQPLQDRKAQALAARESGRKYPQTILALVKKNGINYDTFRGRIRAGWDMVTAATMPTMTNSEIGLMTKEKREKWMLGRRTQKDKGRVNVG